MTAVGWARARSTAGSLRLRLGRALTGPSALFGMTGVLAESGCFRAAEAPLFHGCAGGGGESLGFECNVKGDGQSPPRASRRECLSHMGCLSRCVIRQAASGCIGDVPPGSSANGSRTLSRAPRRQQGEGIWRSANLVGPARRTSVPTNHGLSGVGPSISNASKMVTITICISFWFTKPHN